MPNPSHASLADLDKDGVRDLLIADIGFFMPEDNTKGSVVWLRGRADGSYEKRVLAEKLPRVTDVEAADFDGDGDLDLLVAAFGLYSQGGILLFENRTTDWKDPQFVPATLDARNGALRTEVADIDGDGRPDFVALIAQQHEAVVAFLNRGAGRFEPKTLWTAPTPAWGSTGLQLVDLDRDGDLDVLLTNGATLDDATVRPYHGVRWLENTGGLAFRRHDLAALPGAHRAVAADLDGDGDLDLAAAAFLPDPDRTRGGLTSLGWLEQTQPGRLRAARLAVRPALPHDTRRRRLRRRRARGPRHRELRGLHLRAHRHGLQGRRLGGAVEERRRESAGTLKPTTTGCCSAGGAIHDLRPMMARARGSEAPRRPSRAHAAGAAARNVD